MPPVHLTGVQLVVFDLDDTLYPERQYAFSGFDAVAEWLRGRIACPFDAAARMRELFASADRRHVFDILLAEAGCPSPLELIPQMVACYRNHCPTITLCADAEAALRRWRDRVKLALLSDGPIEMQSRKVQALKLSEVLKPIVLTDAWGRQYWKPHPRGFQELERASEASGPRCLYVADNPSKDFLAPRARGWQTVQISRPEGLYYHFPPPPGGEPDHQVSSLAELELTDPA